MVKHPRNVELKMIHTDPPHENDPTPLAEFARMRDIMARLRDRVSGCPWDIEQSFATIAPYTIEEAYEVADAAFRGDYAGLREELGDLCFQVFFHAQMAAEIGAFTLGDVLDGLAEKMIARHPHVFGGSETGSESGAAVIDSAAAQVTAWEVYKAAERARKVRSSSPSALDDVPLTLPALARGQKLSKRAASTGFDWPDADRVLDKLREELAELDEARAGGDVAAVEEELGDILFVLANLARKLGVEAEAVLASANRKFERRFRAMEALATAHGKAFAALTLEEQEALWGKVKQGEKR